jgi:hypothetical protein
MDAQAVIALLAALALAVLAWRSREPVRAELPVRIDDDDRRA